MARALRGNIHWDDFGPVTGAELSGNKNPANWNRRKHYAQYNAEQSCSTLAKRNEMRPPTTCSSSTTTQGTTWQ